ncbi:MULTISPECIES: hypothetical protein [Serratia]|uniref:hypothetical protein n=1 Tax=Serratia TaxID=613 RepID=UPI002177AF2F|nr:MULTISPECIES: hypothetical protein [Serratia]CAI1005591.1 Uncharacterised protein [Serratia quinivorans]CAI1091642.1 Uncharacterised protein [Serratia quinivorans]CAI2121253.1 Uncharacterised protein [Serratia quinivorans]CAI2488088.1 Uncharacterised protein [Serratia liquefaciens]
MKKQNVNITLLASLVTGLLTLSQGAMAAGSPATTVDFRAKVQETSCNVSAAPAGGSVNMQFGKIALSDFPGGTDTPVGGANYKLLTSTVTPVTLNVSGCTGDAFAVGKGLVMQVNGNGAVGAANDIYGDSNTDQGFGFALGYDITDNTTDAGTKADNGTTTPTTGFITPATNMLTLYSAKTVNVTDTSSLNFDVTIKPQVGSWGQNQQTVTLTTPVTFTVAMN